MTWYYSLANDDSSMEIYEDDPEFTGQIATLQNEGSGFRLPNDIQTVMRETWEAEANLGNSPVMNVRAGHILIDLVTENIKEGKP